MLMDMPASQTSVSSSARWIFLLDYVFILRPTHFFPLWATFFSGYVTASQSALFSISPFPFLAWLVTTLTAGHVYLFNQLADVETDRINHKLFILADGRVALPIIWVEGGVLVFLSLGLSWLVSMEFFLAMVFANVLGLSYTFLGIMNRPIPSLLANSLGGSAAFMAGAYSVDASLLTAHGISFWDLIFWSLPHTFAYAAVSALVTLPDMPGDAQCGKHTIALAYGVQRVLQIALFSDALALLFSLLTMNWHCILTIGLTALISLPFFWHTAQRGECAKIFAPVKYSMLVLTLSVSLFFPMLLLLVAFNFFACRAYYRTRFGVDYPNFQPA
jgi:4-hydroxybenzoate polyprenyltransferase